MQIDAGRGEDLKTTLPERINDFAKVLNQKARQKRITNTMANVWWQLSSLELRGGSIPPSARRPNVKGFLGLRIASKQDGLD